MYMPPLLEALGLAELTHEKRNNSMRAIGTQPAQCGPTNVPALQPGDYRGFFVGYVRL